MIEYVGWAEDDRSRWMGWAYWLFYPWETMGLSYMKTPLLGKNSILSSENALLGQKSNVQIFEFLLDLQFLCIPWKLELAFSSLESKLEALLLLISEFRLDVRSNQEMLPLLILYHLHTFSRYQWSMSENEINIRNLDDWIFFCNLLIKCLFI